MGWLRIVGIGPGPAMWLTPEANAVLHSATDVVGYQSYLAALPESVAAQRHASGNGVELERARFAVQRAAGAQVAVVSGGDAGVFGMAAAVFEVIQSEPKWQQLDVEVVPGLTAVLAAAARVGAPLGHDFCVMSLSDHLKPWSIIEQRLRAATLGDLVLAIYNPAARGRREQIERALRQLAQERGNETPAIVATSVGRDDESVCVTTLGRLVHETQTINMQTLLIVGSSHTRLIERAGRPPLVYTPRFYDAPP